jgi:hypothetical protein
LGAHPLFFEERPRRGHPLDRFQPSVAHDDPLDHDPAELLATIRRSCLDRVGQRQDACPVRIEGPDPVAVGQFGQGRPGGISSRLIVRVGQVPPAMLLFELLESG